MKWKKIGNILILDKNNNYNYNNLKQIAQKHHVKTIIKINKIHGNKRQPQIQILYGEDTQTIHKENKCLFKLDLSQVMWSKGNTNERLRIAQLVKDNETIIDMFAGIGYFSIPIAVHANPQKIHSIEINPNSYKYLKENIKLNKINNINPILGDCKEITPHYKADRIIMGYIKTTHHYLKTAINSLNKNGTIHYHETAPEKLIPTRPLNRIKKSTNRKFKILNIQKIKKYSPGIYHIVIDAQFD